MGINMYNTLDAMSHESKVNAFSSRTMRKFEVKMRDGARRLRVKGHNFDGYSARRELCYAERMALKKDARSLHLALSILKGKSYAEVEQYTREGNEAKPGAILHELLSWGVSHLSKAEVEEWLTS